jgi:glycosyltransferase involved in cell wall biosynthesis
MHVWLDLRRAIAPRADIQACTAMARAVRELRPDIVHAHSSKAGGVARLARALHPRVPVVYTPHGYAFAGHFSRPAERAAYRWAERLLAPLASRVVCTCEAEARLARAIGPGGRVRVVHNGIDPAAPGPPDPEIAELARSGPVIGAVTLLRPGKGLETLIDATPHVLARHPGARVVIVGAGPDLPALQERARSRGVVHAVHFLGPRADPLGALRAFDVFAHPSWAEAFPYVILEAMSLGRAIVASDVGGIGEAVEDGVGGVLVAPRDPVQLSRALGELLDDPERRAALGEQALARARQRFTRAAMIDRLIGVYDESVRASQDMTSVGRTRSEAAPTPPPTTAAGPTR